MIKNIFINLYGFIRNFNYNLLFKIIYNKTFINKDIKKIIIVKKMIKNISINFIWVYLVL